MNDLLTHFSGDVHVCPTTLGFQLSTFEVECFENILNEVKSLNVHERDLINQVARICELVPITAATNSTRKCSFSAAS